MINKIIEASLANRAMVLVGALLLLIWGTYETSRMPVDVFPDLTAPTVTVVAEAHGMAPEEVEALLTFPIETALNGASGVRRVRSSTGVGIAVIWVEFDWGTDIYQARQVVSEKLQLAQSQLPPELPPPVLAPVGSIMGEVMFLALTSADGDTLALKTTADWTIRRRLLAVPGVAQVVPIGGDTKQYQVRLDPNRMAAYGVTVDQVIEALNESNENTSAGFYTEGGQEYLIQGLGRIRRLEDISAAVIRMRGTEPVLVRHIAEVTIGAATKRGVGSHNGKPAVVLGIQKQPGANTLALTEALDTVLDDLQTTLPQGMRIERHVFRQADFISVSIQNLTDALRDGTLLVIAIVFIFLLSTKATTIALLAIPLSLVTAILTMKAMGASLNTMTLGGLAIAIGALVDDAIIVVENIVRRLREHAAAIQQGTRSAVAVVWEATREIQGSIVFATLIIILVFIPIFFLSGIEGRLLQPLGLAYIVSLSASLLVAITVTPVLSLLWLSGSKTVDNAHDHALVRTLKALYKPLLDFAMRQWWLVTGLAVAALIPAIVALVNAGQSFLPDFNEGSLTISAVTLPGTPLEESDRMAQRVEEILIAQPEVVATARRTGRAELDEHAQDVNASEMEVSLNMRERSKEALLEALRTEFARIPGMNITIGQPISHRIDHMLSGTRANIAVKIFGSELAQLRRTAKMVNDAMAEVPGLVDLSIEQQVDIPLLTIKFKRDAIARHGLRVREVAEALEVAFAGHEVTKIVEGQSSFDLLLSYDPKTKVNLDTLRSTLITTESGAQLPLHALAEIRNDRGPNTISRENVQRKIVVMANVAGRDLKSVISDIQARVKTNVSLPAGYHIEYGGQFESAEQASRTLLLIGSLVVVGIFMLLFVAFRSASDALLIMLNLPLALIGGVLGVYLTGGVLSVASIIGFITLFGIATRNGVMMIAHIRHLVEEERVRDIWEAVHRGAMERLTPILMTALATGLALVPLALSVGKTGSEIQAPMAIVILWGLLSSTALNMLVVPALYLRFGAVRQQTQ
jgi:CzcA family heavy metal efflux pump